MRVITRRAPRRLTMVVLVVLAVALAVTATRLLAPATTEARTAAGACSVPSITTTTAATDRGREDRPVEDVPGFGFTFLPAGYTFERVTDQTQPSGALRILVFRHGDGQGTITVTRQKGSAVRLTDLATSISDDCESLGDEIEANDSLQLRNDATNYLFWRIDGDRILSVSSSDVEPSELRSVARGLQYDPGVDDRQPVDLQGSD